MSSDVHSAFKNMSTKDYTVSQICAKTWNVLCFLNFYICCQCCKKLYVCWRFYVCWRCVIRLRLTDFERFLRLLAKYYYICWRFTFAGEVLLHILALYVCWRFTFAGVTSPHKARVAVGGSTHITCYKQAVNNFLISTSTILLRITI